MSRTSDQDEICSRLRLINANGIGPIGFAKLLATHGSTDAAIAFLEHGGRKVPSRDWALREIELAEKQNVRIILKEDLLYPQSLKGLRDAPPVLYAKGRSELLSVSRAVAIVGSRNASLNALKFTEQLASELTENNVLVISGMARGVDAAAHTGALNAFEGTGATIAVLGTGIDRIYPPENQNLYYRIAEQGLLLTECPFAGIATSAAFPRRNRIVSGLSCGVLVTEASEKSGSLITARFAVEQHKLLFAVPGNPVDARAAGPNRLLKSGAVLTEKAADILSELNKSPKDFTPPVLSAVTGDLFTKPLDNSAKTADIPTCPKMPLKSLLSTVPTDIDAVIRRSELDAASVMVQLLDLELAGKIIRLPGNKIALSGSTEKENKK